MLWHLSWKMVPLGTQQRRSRCLPHLSIAVAFANNLFSLSGPQGVQKSSEARSAVSWTLSADYAKPKGMSLPGTGTSGQAGGCGLGMVPMSEQTCPKEKVPLMTLRPALAVSLTVRANTISNGWCSHISISSWMSWCEGVRSKGLLKCWARPASVQTPARTKWRVTNWGMLLPLPPG